MKKTLVFAFMILASSALFAEVMPFVTLLSQPVGSFSKVEITTSDPTRIYHLNFCNKNTSGTVTIGSGASSTNLVQIAKLQANTLKGNIKNYVPSVSANVGKSGSLSAKVLSATTVNFPATSSVVSKKVGANTLVLNADQDVTAEAASFYALDIPGVATFTPTNTRGGTFTWSGVTCNEKRKDDSGCSAKVLHD